DGIRDRTVTGVQTCALPIFETGRHDFRIIAPHGSTINWMDVSDRKEIFEKEPNDDRQHAQPIEFPVLVSGTVKAGDYDYFRFNRSEERRVGKEGRADGAAGE